MLALLLNEAFPIQTVIFEASYPSLNRNMIKSLKTNYRAQSYYKKVRCSAQYLKAHMYSKT